MNKLGVIDDLFSDEAELEGASEEYINDFIYELEAAFASLETEEVDTSKIEAAYDAFKQKYDNIDITNLMDFYDDGYRNLAMLEYIEQYIASGQAVATTSENEVVLAFLNTLDESLEKDKQKETSKQEKEEMKKSSKEKVKQDPQQLIKNDVVEKQERKKQCKKGTTSRNKIFP